MSPDAVTAQLTADVDGLMTEVAAAEVLPRWRNLSAADIRDKGKGDPVTVADLAAEKALKEGLCRLLPGSLFIGEEEVAADPTVLGRLSRSDPIWVVDPVDGTKNFSEGTERFCVMVALWQAGETKAGWIHLPIEGKTAVAAAGQGARLGSAPLAAEDRSPGAGDHASIHLQFMPAAVRRAVSPKLSVLASNTEYYCAGLTYVDLARRHLDLAFFWRTKPWDHLAGELIVREAGGRVATLAGRAYDPRDQSAYGLLACAQGDRWQGFERAFFSDVDREALKAS